MREKRTDLVMILDRSGSMSGLESDTIGGYNSMLSAQKKLPGEVLVTTVLFDDTYTLLHDRKDIRMVSPLTAKDYQIGGTTALYDAIGITLHHIENKYREKGKSGHVIVVVTTDGMENASREYSAFAIRSMIDRLRKTCGFEFIFLGANMDAAEVASDFGISRDRTVTYHADEEGTRMNFKSINYAVENLRCSNSIPDDWKAEIEKDYKNREKRK